MYLTVGDYVGFNVDTDAIYFGVINKSGSGSRIIDIKNTDVPYMVNIESYGELAKWVYVSENNFLIRPYENKSLKVTVLVPPDAAYGNYAGLLKVILRKI